MNNEKMKNDMNECNDAEERTYYGTTDVRASERNLYLLFYFAPPLLALLATRLVGESLRVYMYAADSQNQSNNRGAFIYYLSSSQEEPTSIAAVVAAL